MANTDILVSGQIIDVRDTGTPRLAAEMAFITRGRSLAEAVKLKSMVVPWGALWLIISTTTPVSAKICKYRARLLPLNSTSWTLIIIRLGSMLIFETPYIVNTPFCPIRAARSGRITFLRSCYPYCTVPAPFLQDKQSLFERQVSV